MTQTSSSQAVAAAVPLASDADAQINQYLTFILGAETFALGILSIKEIIEYSSLTEVPMMPAYVRGVINLRGAAVPVIDLSVRFGRDTALVTKRTCIVIIEVMVNDERQVFGVVVDAVNEVLEIPAADIEPPPAFGSGIRTDFMLGMGKVHGKFVVVLDVNHVLAFEELTNLEAAAA